MGEQRPRSRGKRNYRADGEMLRYYRDAAHLTLEELEAAAGVSYTTISRIETGRIVSPRWGTLKPLANALGVDVDSLVIRETPVRSRPDVPEEPAQTQENERKIADVKRDKQNRDEQTRRENGLHDSGDRAT